MRFLKTPIIISITIHVIVFISIMWIKINNEYDISGKVPVTLMEQKNNKLFKRIIPTRSKPILEQSAKRYIPNTSVKFGISDIRSPLIYNDAQSPKYIASVRDLGYSPDLAIEMRHTIDKMPSQPIAIPLKRENNRPNLNNKNITGGDKFIEKNLQILEKPKIQLTQNNGESFRKFLNTVREKIESNKKYPFSAINAGIEGRSGVKLTILINGQLEDVVIIDSSGNKMLDDAALESVRNSVPFPPIPSDIGRDRIEMSVYIIFKLPQTGR